MIKQFVEEYILVWLLRPHLLLVLFYILLAIILMSCSSIDYVGKPVSLINKIDEEITLVTYNIKAIYEKEEHQVDSLMKFINDSKFDFVLFQELFNESTRDYIIEKSDTNFFRTYISRVDYNSFPEFIFQDAGLYMMSSYPRVDLSAIEFEGDINESNGVIHMILDKEISKTNDFLANKSIMGALFEINADNKLFLFNTHVQAIGTWEHKQYQYEQIREFISRSVETVLESDLISDPENLIVILAGDFNNNAYHNGNNRMIELLGNPRDLHKDINGYKQEYTFQFRNRAPSRRFDYILAYDMIGNVKLKNIAVKYVNTSDVKDLLNQSISDHRALKSKLLVN